MSHIGKRKLLKGVNLDFDIPVRLQCFKLPARWTYEQNRFCCAVSELFLFDRFGTKGFVTIAGGPVRQPVLEVVESGIKPGEVTLDSRIDPWEMRRQFLNLKVDDPSSVLAFLQDVGYYDRLLPPGNDTERTISFRANNGQHVYGFDPPPLDVEHLRDFQEFCRDWPCRVSETSNAVFNASIAWTASAATMFITTASFYDAIQAAFAIDQIRHARVRICKRCGNTFPVTGKRLRLYCGYPCAHYVQVRRSRARQKRGKSARST